MPYEYDTWYYPKYIRYVHTVRKATKNWTNLNTCWLKKKLSWFSSETNSVWFKMSSDSLTRNVLKWFFLVIEGRVAEQNLIKNNSICWITNQYFQRKGVNFFWSIKDLWNGSMKRPLFILFMTVLINVEFLKLLYCWVEHYTWKIGYWIQFHVNPNSIAFNYLVFVYKLVKSTLKIPTKRFYQIQNMLLMNNATVSSIILIWSIAFILGS